MQDSFHGRLRGVLMKLPMFDIRVDLDSAGDGDPVIVVTGEVDVATSPELSEVIMSVLAEHSGRIAVDLAGVDFIDATGFNALMVGVEAARYDHRTLMLPRPSYAVSRVFELLQLDTELRVEEDVGRDS